MATIEEASSGAEEGNTVSAGLRALAKILGLRDNFLLELIQDPDDWSFIVKAHALLESVICTLLAMHLRRQELEAVLAEEVEMKARIEMTKALGITTSEDRKAMLALGRLRNKLVHNAKDTSFTFAEYFRNRDARKNFSETFGHGWSDPVGGTEPPVPRGDYVAANPKFAVFESVVKVAMYVVREASKIQTEMALEGLRRVAATPAEAASAPIAEAK
jgi:hypothetical protein